VFLEQNGRSTQAMTCGYVEERQNAIANGTYGEDEIYTMSECSSQESVENDMDDQCDCCSQKQVNNGTMTDYTMDGLYQHVCCLLCGRYV